MPKRAAKSKIETSTAAPLSLPPVVDKRQAMDKLLDVLFEMALKGDLAAAKLYLDFQLKRGSDEPSGLTAEDALKILNDNQTHTAKGVG
jgi:hypothetical protein